MELKHITKILSLLDYLKRLSYIIRELSREFESEAKSLILLAPAALNAIADGMLPLKHHMSKSIQRPAHISNEPCLFSLMCVVATRWSTVKVSDVPSYACGDKSTTRKTSVRLNYRIASRRVSLAKGLLKW